MNELILLEDLGMLYPTEKSKQKSRYGIFKCFCGNEFKTVIRSVKINYTKSCGCYHKKVSTKHNLSHNRIYIIYRNMIQRCNNQKNEAYKNYGARGITICSEWQDNFLSFYEWAIKNGYQDDLTIDRINNDLGYSPDNCRWTTKLIQARNTRKLHSTNKSGYRGVYFYKQTKKWCCKIFVNNKKIHLGYFNTVLDGALAYDKYVTDNNLEHTRNFK